MTIKLDEQYRDIFRKHVSNVGKTKRRDSKIYMRYVTAWINVQLKYIL